MSTQITQPHNTHEREPVAASPEVRQLKIVRLAEADRARLNLLRIQLAPLKAVNKVAVGDLSASAIKQAASEQPAKPQQALDIEALRKQIAESDTTQIVNDSPVEKAPEVTVQPTSGGLTSMATEARALIDQAWGEAA